MTQLQTFQPPNSTFKIQGICINGDPWFRGKDVATFLGYCNERQAIRIHVEDDCKKILSDLLATANEGRLPDSRLDANAKNSIFINDVGLYSLTLSSQKPEAKAFRRWVTSEVLPSIRKTGSYAVPIALPPPPPPPPAITSMFDKADYAKKNAFYMQSEDDLHSKVVRYIRRYYPHAMMNPGLGEFQRTDDLRLEGFRKGYQKGTADLTILNKHLEYSGFCVEFKTPKGDGSLSASQEEWLRNLHINGWKVLVSNDYDAIVKELDAYFQKVRIACPKCVAKPTYYKSEATLQQHMVAFHRINN
jgi:prophage antirepressor-like protein